MSDDEQKPWFDFKEIKESANVERVLELCGVLDRLKQQGTELVGWCPLGKPGHGKNDSFSFNTQKKTFQCFACKARGSVLDFVGQFHKLGLREAAAYVQDVTSTRAEYGPKQSALQKAMSAAEKRPPQDHFDEVMDALVAATGTVLDDDPAIVPVMTLAVCLRKIQAGELHPSDVRCMDVGELFPPAGKRLEEIVRKNRDR